MTTTYKELIRQVMLRMQPRTDGVTRLAVEQSINDAQRMISAVKDFDELMALDTSNATTVANTASYNIDTDFSLTRVKDIYSVRLMANEESRKLTYVPFRQLDEEVPYTEQTGTGKSAWYTLRGRTMELYRIPDDAYPLYIQHSKWPQTLSNEADTTEFLNIDYAIVSLATDMAIASLEGGGVDWFARAKQLLGIAIKEELTRPDQFHVAQPFCSDWPPSTMGEYWNNPWVKKQPE